jgi:15-cis-phytoene synthase
MADFEALAMPEDARDHAAPEHRPANRGLGMDMLHKSGLHKSRLHKSRLQKGTLHKDVVHKSMLDKEMLDLLIEHDMLDPGVLAASAMRKHGRTFFLASTMLGEPRRPIEALYRLCRYVDDIADGDTTRADAPTKQAGGVRAADRLQALNRALSVGDERSPFVRSALLLHTVHGLPLAGLHRLIDEALREQDFHRPQDADALWRYAFGVAGVVGWMLCPLLGVRDPKATPAAVALGIAMQLTNIARDVCEDAALGRVYLPHDLAPSLDAASIVRGDPMTLAQAHAARLRLLDTAEAFYALAETGMSAIPPRPRVAIRAAARMYRDIGAKVRVLGVAKIHTRAVVSGRRKAVLLAAIGRQPKFGAPAFQELPLVLREELAILDSLR